MTIDFPYKILNKHEICQQINYLSTKHTPFLFIIDYKAEYGFVIPQNELNSDFISFQIEHTSSDKLNANISDKYNFNWVIQPLSLQAYQPKFDYVQAQIHQGNSFLTNLTQPTTLTTNLSLSDIFKKSKAKYKLWVKNQFTVLSPETFVQIRDGKISSFPMKGTIDATLHDAENKILNDLKEKAEHATIVDLIRNDLSIVAENVQVKRFRYVETLRTNQGELLQVSSEISGDLPHNFYEKLGDILFSLLPAGSICGAPKAKTLEIIDTVEGYERGFYTGIFGFFDGQNFDSAVMIRFIEQQGDQLVFKSGGGITSKSELHKEYNELIQKVYVPIY